MFKSHTRERLIHTNRQSVMPDDTIIVEGEHVARAGTYSGTHKATGKSFSARFAHIFEVRNGKIIRFEQFVDSAEVDEALT